MNNTRKTVSKHRKRTKLNPEKIQTNGEPFSPAEVINIGKRQESKQSNHDTKSIETLKTNDHNNKPSEPLNTMKHIVETQDIIDIKIDILDEKQSQEFEAKSPEINAYEVVDKDEEDKQSTTLFNASAGKKNKTNNLLFLKKLSKKSKLLIKSRNIQFKLKHPKNTISKKLAKYQEKTKRKSTNPYSKDFPTNLCSDQISTLIARSQVLKRASGKENLISEVDRKFLNEVTNLNKTSASIASSASSTTNSFKSFTSQKTLMPHQSVTSSLENEDFFSLETACSSAIQVAADKTTFNTGTTNVALAITCESVKKPSRTELVIERNTESVNTLIDITKDEPTNEGKAIIETKSEDSSYLASCTSSNYNRSSLHSELTLINGSDISNENSCQNVFKQDINLESEFTVETNLFTKIINLEQDPVIPSTSERSSDNELNNVIVTETHMTNIPLININDRGEKSTRQKWSKNIFHNIDYGLETDGVKDINNFPNDTTKRVNQGEDITCSGEGKSSYSVNVNEMWERLTLAMELAVKKLEESLSEKILKELKKTLSTLKQHTSQLVSPTTSASKPETTIYNTTLDAHETANDERHEKCFTVQCVQCDLVQNHVIDRLMLNLSVGDSKMCPTISFGNRKPQLQNLYPKVSKAPPNVTCEGKGDTIEVATVTSHVVENHTVLSRLSSYFSRRLMLVRQNFFVLVSVPTFFIVLFCLYELFLFIINAL